MKPYAVYLHLDLLEIVPNRGDQRRMIMRFIRLLGDRPDTPGDFTEHDDSLRTLHVKIVGNFAVTYWIDDPVRAVMVIAIHRADR